MENAVEHPIDALSDVDLFRELVAFFGGQRVVELVGWAFLSGLVSQFVAGGDPVALRGQLEDRGLTRSSLYRALRDLRRFGEHIEQKKYPAQDHAPTLHILNRLSAMRTA
jgi:hypothetical protein